MPFQSLTYTCIKTNIAIFTVMPKNKHTHTHIWTPYSPRNFLARIQEWVAYPFSSGSSWPRNWTGVSCIAGGFFTNWAIREAHIYVCVFVCVYTYIYIYTHVYCCCCSAAKLCLTLCNSMDCSLPGSSVHGILQTRMLDGLPFPSPYICFFLNKRREMELTIRHLIIVILFTSCC